MSIIYVSPDAIGNDDGTTKTDAFVAIQSAFDSWSPGDTVYCKGIEVLTSEGVPGSGGTVSNPIKVVGVNASWVEDGTNYVLDGDGSNQVPLLSFYPNIHWSNIKCTGGTLGGLSDVDGCTFYDCDFSVNTGYGVQGLNSTFFQCSINGNTADGIDGVVGSNSNFLFCEIKNNGGYGFDGSGAHLTYTFNNCIIHNNTLGGLNFNTTDYVNSVTNCIIDGNGSHGIVGVMEHLTVTGCRFTNNAGWGIYDATADGVLTEGFNAFYNNSSGEISCSNVFNVGADTSMSGDGYTDQPNDDFTYAAGAEATSTTVYVGKSMINLCGVTSGLTMPATATPATPTFAGITRLECLSDGSLLAKCAEITDTHTSYNIYIKPTNATGLFADTYLIKVVTPTITSSVAEFILRTEADDSTYLSDGTEYFVGIRAENDGSEDTNTVSLSQKSLGISVPRRLPISVEVI